MSETNRERDLVLAPNEYAFISDQTKGNINVYVGPYKTSLANTDKPVLFADSSKRFEKCTLDEAVCIFTTAPEGWYIVMKNPAKDNLQPKNGTNNNLTDLLVGRKVNIPGPVNFAVWPGQMIKVLRGHNLRSNEYLLVRIYDEDEARKNWKKAVIKTKEDTEINLEEMPDLTMGTMLLIKGSDVSFYIPPTGVEVVSDENDEYVREAITLERLEYCILLDEDGNKRFIQGPAVVFPQPTEEFVMRDESRKFKAVELNEMSGLYIKVIAPYSDAKGSYKEGDELFITGKDQMIYYPRAEHALVRYGNKDKQFATAIPPGEGRYFLNRKTGTISLQKGAAMFLPDPREFVIVRRILSAKQVALWFPGNTEALEYNLKLQELQQNDKSRNYIESNQLDEVQQIQQEQSVSSLSNIAKQKVSKKIAGDNFARDSNYVPPRTITLDNKYDGAVTISPYTGYAVLIVSRTGTRKVVSGPQTYLLEYDETLESMELSTGTPKNADSTLKTVYLRVLYNKISDIIQAESMDFTQVSVHLSYRVNFEGEPEKWFDVENYVKFLTDHMRSFVRNIAKKHSIMDFYNNGIEIIRDAILGKPDAEGKRKGRLFEENGMRIYDVEFLGNIKLMDLGMESLLIASQQDIIKQNLRIATEKRKLEFTQESEMIVQGINDSQAETKKKLLDIRTEEVIKNLELSMAVVQADTAIKFQKSDADVIDQENLNKINQAELSRRKEKQELEISLQQQFLEQELVRMQSEVEALVAKAGAISPNLVAALQSFSDKALAEKVAQSMSPLAILGGKSVAEVFSNLLQGTILANVLDNNNDNTDIVKAEEV